MRTTTSRVGYENVTSCSSMSPRKSAISSPARCMAGIRDPARDMFSQIRDALGTTASMVLEGCITPPIATGLELDIELCDGPP